MQRLLVEILDDDVSDYTPGELALTVSDAYVAGGAHVKVTALSDNGSYEYNPHVPDTEYEIDSKSIESDNLKSALRRLDEIMLILNNCANTGHTLLDTDYEAVSLRIDAVKNVIRTIDEMRNTKN